MKILHIVSTYPPYRGGMGNVVFEEVTRLARRRHNVHVATLASPAFKGGVRGGRPDTRKEGKVTVHRLKPTIGFGKAGLPLSLNSLIRSGSFDVVHLHMPFFGVHELMVLMIKLRWKGKLVVTYHMDIVASGFVKKVAEWSRTYFVPTILTRTQKVFVSSMGYARDSWLKDSWDDVKGKIVVAPFGVDTKRFKPRRDRKTSEKTRFVFVGGLDSNHYFKGMEVLIDAFAELKDRDDWSLTVVGDGDLKQSYLRRVHDHRIENRIEFVGRASDQALPMLYGFADVSVFPSIDRSEAFGLVALEAQACGIPVIASDLSGVRTVVSDKNTGILVTPKSKDELVEALIWMIENPRERQVMGKKARERVEKMFTWDKHVDILEQVYENIDSK